MGWVVYFVVTVVAGVVLVPLRDCKRLWPAGIFGLLLIFLIDTTLIRFHAFSYSYGTEILYGLPVFYWLGGFFQGIALTYFYPAEEKRRLPYIARMAGVFLIIELVMYGSGYFQYHEWNPLKSYFLNLSGFSLLLVILGHFRLTGATRYEK